MRNKKKQLLFGCLAALVLSAGAFPAFAQDQDSFSTNMESGSQNSVPVAVDITAVYGRNAKPGSFVPIRSASTARRRHRFPAHLLSLLWRVITMKAQRNTSIRTK